MTLLLLAYLGGILTIISPCILPVLPFVFSRAGKRFWTNGLPLLAGMAITFAAVATLAVVGGGWVVRANQYGRFAALIILAVFGLSLLFPSLSERFSRPLVRLGGGLTRAASAEGGSQEPGSSVFRSLLLGAATGLLWAPCAGPILGLLLTGAAIGGPSKHTSFLLLAYAAGAATSLAAALLAGGRVFALMKRSLAAEGWIRRGLGAAVLLAVIAIALGLDRGILTRVSLAGTSGVEQSLVDRFHPQPRISQTITISANSTDADSSDEMPSLQGAVAWLNSPPLNRVDLKGKVVLIDFWTYSCINCLRTLPYVRGWAQRYKDSGLVVIGVHTPEFAFEKDQKNVEKAVRDLGITYPVALDSNYVIWNAFNNEYWPADYFVDATGKIRFHHFGEGAYDESEQWIRTLLKERKAQPLPAALTHVRGTGVEAAPDIEDVRSPETYIGYARTQQFASPEGQRKDFPRTYTAPAHLDLNQWALTGTWTVKGQMAVLNSARGAIRFCFHARDLNLVLGPSADGKPIRFRISIDGHAPGNDHGVDTDAQGQGTIAAQRMYQLVRQKGGVEDRVFEIEFLAPGAEAFAFTFG